MARPRKYPLPLFLPSPHLFPQFLPVPVRLLSHSPTLLFPALTSVPADFFQLHAPAHHKEFPEFPLHDQKDIPLLQPH